SLCVIDDGFGVYEIMDVNDPIEERDEEFEDKADVFASGIRRFDEPSAVVEETTKEVYKVFVKVESTLVDRHVDSQEAIKALISHLTQLSLQPSSHFIQEDVWIKAKK
ncbi:hypothetical protein Taro_034364, partial [Colocasia esculenta]|nr:hypothetical protein [Colocasia esculenta]